MSNSLQVVKETLGPHHPEEIPMSRALRARWEGVAK